MKFHFVVSLSLFFILISFCSNGLNFVSADITEGQVIISNAAEEPIPIINQVNTNIGGNARYLCNYDSNYDWGCSVWSNCIDGKQTQECKKTNNCGNDYGRPVTEISCESKTDHTPSDNTSIITNNTTADNISDNASNPKKALFDILSEVISEPKKSGEDLVIKISLINFGSPKSVDANLEYAITDNKGEIVRQYSQIIPVTTQTEFIDKINTIGLMDGRYTLKITLTYAGQTDSANTEKIFYVGSTGVLQGLWRGIDVKTSVLPIIAMILLIGLYKISSRNRLKETKDKPERLNKIDDIK